MVSHRSKGKVYLIQCCIDELFHYKIGSTKRTINERLKEFKTGNSNQLEVIHTYESNQYKYIEKVLHSRYKSKQIEGEWFILNKRDVNNFLDICKEIESQLVSLKENNNPFV